MLVCRLLMALEGTAVSLNLDKPETQYIVTTSKAWPKGITPRDDEQVNSADVVRMKDSEGRPFVCYLPTEEDQLGGPDDKAEPGSAWDLLADANNTCTLWRSGWWMHELCHGRRLRQYHKVRCARVGKSLFPCIGAWQRA